jgi:hypothetical protein
VTDDRSLEQTQGLVDVDRLVDHLRERAERERRDGPGIDAETRTAASAMDVHRPVNLGNPTDVTLLELAQAIIRVMKSDTGPLRGQALRAA